MVLLRCLMQFRLHQISPTANKIYSKRCSYLPFSTSSLQRCKDENKGQVLTKNSAEYNKDEKSKNSKLKQTGKLAKVFAEFGTTAVVFHTSISLTSLGISYLAVSSGIDVMALLQKLHLVNEVTTESKLASGAGTFVIAYACHKVFMPFRVFLTVTCTPLLVKKLRQIGILKAPVR